MKTYFIRPINFNEYPQKFEIQYIDYTKKEALQRYREAFPQLKLKEIVIDKSPYCSF